MLKCDFVQFLDSLAIYCSSVTSNEYITTKEINLLSLYNVNTLKTKSVTAVSFTKYELLHRLLMILLYVTLALKTKCPIAPLNKY